MQPTFPTHTDAIIQRLESVDPIRYAVTRNFIDGAVSYLSPYISRGVISTKFVLERLLDRGYDPKHIEKFIQELAWREYYQRIWQVKGMLIDRDLRQPQPNVRNHRVPISIMSAATGIAAVDKAIEGLLGKGYIHNHVRMYIASIACNIGGSHWLEPARWMYYHLLDGDWASNAISWQWVAGASSSKRYFADQQNVNRYCHTQQSGTFLDHEYSELARMPVPSALSETAIPDLRTVFPASEASSLDPALPLFIYNTYNLDPFWRADEPANRVLLLEPSVFDRYPVSAKVIDFCLALGRNMKGLKVVFGEFSELADKYSGKKTCFKEHPLNRHYSGIEDKREWMFDVEGYYPSFFSFWRKCERLLK